MGTEAFWIPAVVSALGATAGAVNQHQAQTRENNDEVSALQHQQELQSKAAGQASALTRKIAASNPQQAQAQATGDYVAQLRKNAAGTSQTSAGSSLAPAAGASSRYNNDVVNSQNTVSNYGNTQANTMGAIDAAVRQRQGEGLDMSTLGTNLNSLNSQSYGTNFVDQLRARSDSMANPWVGLGANLIQAGAAGYRSSAAPNAGSVARGAAATYGQTPVI